MVIVFLGMIIGISFFSISYINKIAEVQRKGEIKINNQIIVAETVKSARDREKGLSGRKSLGINEGMLFVFDKPDKYPFWMKDMNFPIDIIWIAGSQVVGYEEYVSPQIGVSDSSLRIYYPPQPVDEVLEISAGRSRLLDLKIGDILKVRPLVPGY